MSLASLWKRKRRTLVIGIDPGKPTEPTIVHIGLTSFMLEGSNGSSISSSMVIGTTSWCSTFDMAVKMGRRLVVSNYKPGSYTCGKCDALMVHWMREQGLGK